MMLIMVLLFVALFVGLFALGTGWYQQEQGRIMRDRLLALAQAAQRAPREDLALLRDELLSAIPAFNKLLSKSARISHLQRYLLQANVQMRPGKFLLATTSLAVIAAMSAWLLRAWWGLPFLAAIAGVALPFLYVSRLRKARFYRFAEKFPDAIDLLVRAVRAGHSLASAVELIAQELPEPLAGEFRKVFEEQKFGMPMRDALLNLSERIPVLDVRFFVTAVLLQRESGGNLAEILEKLTYLIRERFKLLRQLRVYTAHARVTMFILMGMPVGWLLLVTTTNPDYVRPLYTEPLGQKFLVVAALLQLIGFFLIRKIARIQV